MKFSISVLWASALVLACSTSAVRGQTSDGRPMQTESLRERGGAGMRPEPEKAVSEMSGPRSARRGAYLPPPRRAMTEEHKRRLSPSAEERDRFAAFLRQPHTGLVRLLPQSNCVNDPRVVNVGSACLDAEPPVPGGGSFYSFVSGDYQSARLADVWLKDGVFRAGVAGDALGVLAALGDVPLDSVTPLTAGVAYLAEFSPPDTLADAQRQHGQNNAGFRAKGQSYGMAARVQANTTYVLRSILYGADNSVNKTRKPADVLVSFRVVSKAEDGSVTLLWRELLRRKPPKLKT